jgi:recombination protein RecR
MKSYPEKLTNLIKQIATLKGIGSKTAEKLAFDLLSRSKDELDEFAYSILSAKENITQCKNCHSITDNEDKLCEICKSYKRDENLLCIVETFKEVAYIEEAGVFKGKYHVLGGKIDPLNGVFHTDLNIGNLITRLGKLLKSSSSIIEVILSLSTTTEGKTTQLYLNKVLKENFKNKVKITHLAYGMPLNTYVENIDMETLERCLLNRSENDL